LTPTHLECRPRDKATNKEQKVTITASTNLSKEEIDRKVNEAREHEADDRRQKELIEARNLADNIAYQTEKMLRDLGDKVPQTERQDIEARVKDLRESLKGNDTAQLRRQSEELQTRLHALSQQMYAQGEPAGENGSGSSGKERTDEGEVYEGEFTTPDQVK
jgi:molecular chaperone DnaK